MARKYPEADLQEAVVKYLRLAIKPPCRFWFCPNGGNLSKVQRARFQRMGLTPGASDLHFAWQSAGKALFGCIELKAKAGRLSDEQTQFLADMGTLGHGWAVCKSIEEVERVLRMWEVPLHATMGEKA